MKVSVIKNEGIINFVLPPQVHGNYWITDKAKDGKDRNFINIVENNGKWQMLSNYEVTIYNDGEKIEKVDLELGKFYLLKVNREDDALVYCSDVYSSKTAQLTIKNSAEMIIGSKDTCQIQYINNYVEQEHARLVYKDNVWHISALSNTKNVYVNREKVINKKLDNGDVIFIMGLKIIVIKNNLIIDNIDKIKVDSNLFMESRYPKQNVKIFEESDEEILMYKDSDYFFKAPRFRNNPDKIVMQIDSPPAKQEEDKTPLLFSIGPMLTMGMTSAVSAFTAINSVVTNHRPLKEALPSIIMAVAMLCTMLLWPLLNKSYRKKQFKAQEKMRVDKYTEYIEQRRNYIRNVMQVQTNALIESFPASDELKKIILFRKTNLWEREKDQDDFLRVRVGTGTEPVNIDIRYPEEHFSLQVDDLKQVTNKLVSDSKDLENVPITVSFVDKYISALVGESPIIEKVSYGIILQLMAYFSYDDLKLVFFTNEEKAHFWEFAKVLPHCFNDDKSVRYFAETVDEMKQVSSTLEAEFQARAFNEKDSYKEANYKAYKPYYFIITDDFKNARDIEIIKNVLDQKVNYGFTLLILNDKLTNLPNECMNFISIGHNNRGVIFEDELVTNRQKKFIADYDETLDLTECAVKLANIPIDSVKDEVSFPKSISFLEMYNVGKVEQLNSFNRWQINQPINSLQAPLGVDKQGNIFKLDLHEKFHGPHGLIAGMTGSGKSELIITYILSLAVNYHPYEVSFIIIDYKGGGVALAFENKETGRKLPHIAGTITNLDTAEMNRALTSIESELRRRQKAFNKARDISNESTIDIYKYQKLYRSGIVSEPISHLFIICDEFAELKTQQPEFMDQLISTARIGRSLGVHLILATQKPSGVVNDQIWSNSRFRICLKVQEKEDSMDMIKSPEAAMLKNVGRFYLQVGYNEFFAQGLAAWSGAPYIPTDKPKKKVDNAISFVDNIGYVYKSVDDEKDLNLNSKEEQLSSVINYLIDVAKEEKIEVKQLWLDKIPELIYVDELAKKYNYVAEPGIINPIIGEYDDPANQRQDLLTVNLSKGGNTIVYGSAGSGKNTFISSLIYSTITNHSAEEVNFYIMDFGSEIFRTYKKAPQVGDVLLANDTEKINNLFKMLFSKLSERKKILSEYNGDFNYYNKKSGKKMPLIVVVINNYEGFFENYDMHEEHMLQLTREASMYGIVFVLSASATNSIRYRLRQNFKQEFVLQLNDETDYSSILGNIHKKYPSKMYGRGLVKLDDVYEFQTSHPYDPEHLSEHISELCEKLKSESEVFAEQVAVLPDIVTADDINAKLKGIDSIPIGINKNSLAVSTWDFSNNIGTIISALEFDSMNFFIQPFIDQFKEIKNSTVLVFDAADLTNNLEKAENIFYYKNDFNKVIDSLEQTAEKQKQVYINNNYNKEIFNNVKPVVCIIVGLDAFLLKLSPEAKNKYNTLIEIANMIQTIKFIFFDTIDIFKKIEYDNWYKAIVKNNQGLWIGNGISEQYTLKISKITRELQADLETGFGYVVRRGVPVLTKFLTTDEGYKGDDYE